MLLTVTLEILLVSRYVTALFAALCVLSFILWFPLLWFIPLIADVNEMIGMAPLLFPSPVFWLAVALCGATTLAYRLAWLAGTRHFRPHDVDIALEAEVAARREEAAARSRAQPRARGSASSAASDELPLSLSRTADGV